MTGNWEENKCAPTSVFECPLRSLSSLACNRKLELESSGARSSEKDRLKGNNLSIVLAGSVNGWGAAKSPGSWATTERERTFRFGTQSGVPSWQGERPNSSLVTSSRADTLAGRRLSVVREGTGVNENT